MSDKSGTEDTGHNSKHDEGFISLNLDFPDWVVRELDRYALQVGVDRQDLIKMWIAEKLKS